jgi:hypothetical protein
MLEQLFLRMVVQVFHVGSTFSKENIVHFLKKILQHFVINNRVV